MEKTKMFLSVLFVALLLFFTNIGYVLEVTTQTPLEYKNLPFPVERHMYFQGDTLRFQVERCLHTKEPIVVISSRHFVNVDNGDIISVPGNFRVATPGCLVTMNSFVDFFPDNMSSGRYYLEGVSTMQYGTATTQTIWRTQEFRYQRVSDS